MRPKVPIFLKISKNVRKVLETVRKNKTVRAFCIVKISDTFLTKNVFKYREVNICVTH